MVTNFVNFTSEAHKRLCPNIGRIEMNGVLHGKQNFISFTIPHVHLKNLAKLYQKIIQNIKYLFETTEPNNILNFLNEIKLFISKFKKNSLLA